MGETQEMPWCRPSHVAIFARLRFPAIVIMSLSVGARRDPYRAPATVGFHRLEEGPAEAGHYDSIEDDWVRSSIVDA
jgi:hypothetical protein